jgi:hypothetical protein
MTNLELIFLQAITHRVIDLAPMRTSGFLAPALKDPHASEPSLSGTYSFPFASLALIQ